MSLQRQYSVSTQSSTQTSHKVEGKDKRKNEFLFVRPSTNIVISGQRGLLHPPPTRKKTTRNKQTTTTTTKTKTRRVIISKTKTKKWREKKGWGGGGGGTLRQHPTTPPSSRPLDPARNIQSQINNVNKTINSTFNHESSTILTKPTLIQRSITNHQQLFQNFSQMYLVKRQNETLLY